MVVGEAPLAGLNAAVGEGWEGCAPPGQGGGSRVRACWKISCTVLAPAGSSSTPAAYHNRARWLTPALPQETRLHMYEQICDLLELDPAAPFRIEFDLELQNLRIVEHFGGMERGTGLLGLLVMVPAAIVQQKNLVTTHTSVKV